MYSFLRAKRKSRPDDLGVVVGQQVISTVRVERFLVLPVIFTRISDRLFAISRVNSRAFSGLLQYIPETLGV